MVIGGSGKDVGKTTLVCAVISALPEFGWTAVKITGHDYELSEEGVSAGTAGIREETRAGEKTDTERYLAAGARRALLVMRIGSAVSVSEIRRTLGGDKNVIFESNRIVDAVEPDVCLALVGGTERKASFERLLLSADGVVVVGGTQVDGLPDTARRFELESVNRLSPELVDWLRRRLTESANRHRSAATQVSERLSIPVRDEGSIITPRCEGQ